MNTKILKAKTILAALVVSLIAVSGALATPLYQQNWDGTGNAFSSQNDTSGGGFGNFATCYENFTLGANSAVNTVGWTGGYFNPPTQGTITGFTISFWADGGGTPGALLQSFSIGGNAGETSLGTFGGIPTFSYSANLGSAFNALSGIQYWISIVPDLAFPPQWGWSSGTGGDGDAVQDFFGSRGNLGTDLAFTLDGTNGSQVPDSGDTVLLLTGTVVVLGLLRWRDNGATA